MTNWVWVCASALGVALGACSDDGGGEMLVGAGAGGDGTESAGSESAGSGGGNGGFVDARGGQVTSQWEGYCVATFTRDFEALDVFDNPAFTARPGDRYLIRQLDGSFGRAELLFLTEDGPSDFFVEPEDEGFPFTTNCSSIEVRDYYAVFTDVTVFQSEELDEVLCELAAGTALPTDETSATGFGLLSDNSTGPLLYSVDLNAFSSQCAGATEGYISVPETEVHGSVIWLVPILTIIGPT